jgi:hypothetical protein
MEGWSESQGPFTPAAQGCPACSFGALTPAASKQKNVIRKGPPDLDCACSTRSQPAAVNQRGAAVVGGHPRLQQRGAQFCAARRAQRAAAVGYGDVFLLLLLLIPSLLDLITAAVRIAAGGGLAAARAARRSLRATDRPARPAAHGLQVAGFQRHCLHPDWRLSR